MDEMTQQLLRLIPGLLFISGRYSTTAPIARLLYEHVPPSDASATLTLPMDGGYESGTWVKIARGRYKGDIGFVLSVERTGYATVLLLPRLQPPISGLTDKKRKRHGSIPRPPPQLFEPQVVAATFGIQPKQKDTEGVWRFKGSTYDHGLLQKIIKPGAATPSALVPTNFSFQFALSDHPAFHENLSVFRRPMGWEFSPDEKVVFLKSQHKGQKAIIVAVEEEALYAELSTGEVVQTSWFAVRKDISIGNFMKVIGGPESGKTGWVNSIDKFGVLGIVENYGNTGSVEEVNLLFCQC